VEQLKVMMINEILANTYEHVTNQQQQQHQPQNQSNQVSHQQQQQQQSQSTSKSDQQNSAGNKNFHWIEGGSNSATSPKSDSGKKIHRCDICGIGFTAIGSIKRHKDAVHFGIRKKFTERECPICHKSFFQLQKHINIKHKESKVKCGICDRVLSCSFSYKRHLKKVHGFFKDEEKTEAPSGIKVAPAPSNKKNMDFSGFNAADANSTPNNYKKPDPPFPGPFNPFDPMMASRMEHPPGPPHDFHHLMPGMYPPPFTPFKRDYAPPPQQSSSSSSGSSVGSNMPGSNQYGAPPYESPYQYPPFYMNDRMNTTTQLLKNGTKELANILGIDTGNIQGKQQGSAKRKPQTARHYRPDGSY